MSILLSYSTEEMNVIRSKHMDQFFRNYDPSSNASSYTHKYTRIKEG